VQTQLAKVISIAMALIRKFNSEIPLPTTTRPRINTAGNLTWFGNGCLAPGCHKEKLWVKAIPNGHNYRIANEALGLILGNAINAPVIDRAAIIKVNVNSDGWSYLENSNCSPFVWVSPHMGKTLDIHSTKQMSTELAQREEGVRLVLMNTLLDNWDQITLVSFDDTTVSAIDFDKSFNASDWQGQRKLEQSKRANWIAMFAIAGRPALNNFNKHSQQTVDDLQEKIPSIRKEFLEIAKYLEVSEESANLLIDHIQEKFPGLQCFCSKAIQEHPYFQ